MENILLPDIVESSIEGVKSKITVFSDKSMQPPYSEIVLVRGHCREQQKDIFCKVLIGTLQ